MNDCDRCRDICGFHGWFPLGVIRLCRVQVLFCMEHIDLLRDGKYPPRPSGYTGIDPAIRSIPRFTPQWMKVAELAAELDARLSSVPGIQRRLFEVECESGWDDEVLDPNDRPSGYSWQVLNYVSGWRRKRLPFPQWQKQKRFRAK